ncbi:hypothetical protein Taro_047193 [Colocasia esculenta]|uniref:Uncharacterized protein n=1 Tax=Colocasia esculenta TaxID=4460 RepID=A0A843WUL9_COLES|nr:hypothetical protein [Colocasia esculenta]
MTASPYLKRVEGVSLTNKAHNPRHTPSETKKLTEPRSNHVRPESHDTRTNILDLLEVGKEQPGVTSRDTKQPSENDVSPPGTATSTSTRSRAHKKNHPGPWTRQEVRELHTPVPPQTTPRNGLLNQRSGAYTRHPERTHRTETTNHGPQGQTNQTQGSETRLGYNHRVNQGNKNTSSETACEATSQQEQPSQSHRHLRGGHTVHTSSMPAADCRLQPPHNNLSRGQALKCRAPGKRELQWQPPTKTAQLACNQDKPSRHRHARHPFHKPPEGPLANSGTHDTAREI